MANPHLIEHLLHAYARLGLNDGQALCLMHLVSLAERGAAAVRMAELAGRMGKSRRGAQKIVSGLVARGFLEREEERGTLLLGESTKDTLLWQD
jgi:DNA-binding MarR family transcriptional regulator